jgi:hypothetical protein
MNLDLKIALTICALEGRKSWGPNITEDRCWYLAFRESNAESFPEKGPCSGPLMIYLHAIKNMYVIVCRAHRISNPDWTFWMTCYEDEEREKK